MICNEPCYAFLRSDEIVSQVASSCGAHEHEQADSGVHHRIALIHGVSDALIVGERVPTSSPNLTQPVFVTRVRPEMFGMLFCGKPGFAQAGWKSLTEIAVAEEDNQAASS